MLRSWLLSTLGVFRMNIPSSVEGIMRFHPATVSRFLSSSTLTIVVPVIIIVIFVVVSAPTTTYNLSHVVI